MFCCEKVKRFYYQNILNQDQNKTKNTKNDATYAVLDDNH